MPFFWCFTLFWRKIWNIASALIFARVLSFYAIFYAFPMFEPSFGVLFRDCWATLWPLDWDRTNTRDDWYKSFWCAFTCLMIDISFWCGHLSKIRLTDNSLIELRKQRLWFLVESFLQMSKYQSSPNHFLWKHHHNRINEQNNILKLRKRINTNSNKIL